MGFWPVVLNVLRNSDVVLLLVDARMPEVGRNSEIVNNVKKRGRRLVYVFNKIDLISKRGVEDLKKEYPDGFFISCKKRAGVQKLKKFLEELASRKSSLRGRAHSSNGKARFVEISMESYSRGGSLRVGIVGYPNIGKSTLINLLVPGARVKVSPISGTTRKTQWIRDGRLRIMDSPGVIPFGDSGARVGVMSGKDAHKIRNPEKVALSLLGEERGGSRGLGVSGYRRVEAIKKFYGVKGGSAGELFEAIGRKRGYLVKGGVVDENRVAIRVIEDWQRGRIKLL